MGGGVWILDSTARREIKRSRMLMRVCYYIVLSPDVCIARGMRGGHTYSEGCSAHARRPILARRKEHGAR